MSARNAIAGPPVRGPAWKWWVCGLLLLATMLNYMDRLTLNLTALRILDDFCLTEKDYGRIESAFAVAFALGAVVAGWLADRWNVRWLYAGAVLGWSLAGYATGWAQGLLSLLLCRFLLGLFEAGNWPCALRTTQRIVPPTQRTLGNGILQSGAALGAVLIPLLVLLFVRWTDTWRYLFMAVGMLGFGWIFLWLVSVRSADLALPRSRPPQAAVPPVRPDDAPALRVFLDRRFGVLVVLVITINIAWHFFRAWLPLFLQKEHHYSETATSWFIFAYYVATDLGSLCAGFGTLALTRRGVSVHRSRLLVFFACALLTSLSVAAALLPSGPLLLAVLLVIGFGALGLFPNYYTFSQELTVRHQGKVTGVLGCSCWLAMALLHEVVGQSIQRTGSYTMGVALAGLAPLVGFGVLIGFWGSAPRPQPPAEEDRPVPAAAPAQPAAVDT
jgi:ACS family hexuronate transporter-like MFS transporter